MVGEVFLYNHMPYAFIITKGATYFIASQQQSEFLQVTSIHENHFFAIQNYSHPEVLFTSYSHHKQIKNTQKTNNKNTSPQVKPWPQKKTPKNTTPNKQTNPSVSVRSSTSQTVKDQTPRGGEPFQPNPLNRRSAQHQETLERWTSFTFEQPQRNAEGCFQE